MRSLGERWDERTVGIVGVVVLMVLALLAGGGVASLLWAGRDAPSVADDGCTDYRTVDMAVSPALSGVLMPAMSEISPACTTVNVTYRTGGEVALGVASGGRAPDVWIPDARFWMTPLYLGETTEVRTVARSVARTPVLLVGGPAAQRFGSWGEAEVSGLVTMPDPSTTTAGSLAVVAPQSEAASVGRSLAAARQMVVPFAQKYSERRADGLDEDVNIATIGPESPRLLVTTEQQLAGAQQDATHLRDLTPAVGAPTLDFPMVVRKRAAEGSAKTARAVREYLASDEGLAALHKEGLRGPDGLPGPDSPAEVSTLMRSPSPRAIAATVQSWRTLSVPSSILAVVDASGSMDEESGGRTRMEVLAEAAGIGLTFLPDHARVGLWTFSTDQGGPGQDWRVLEPMERLDELRFGRTQRYALRERARQLPDMTEGGTALYATALAAYRQAVVDYRPEYSNAVVLMTDGADDGAGSLERLLERLEAAKDPERPVRIVGIAIGADGDLGSLERMAEVTGGHAYLAEQPEDILEVFAQAVLSR
ncbi:substrate-binding domain-containing protein [Nocardioides sediminis]|uniref:substrate-binding domain-containing protein n=1 Tax=Nocardioides sediminis TaxID=433648 RepID=UPI000D2F658C|nr:substrate-binding domain-containing protein [Nocardioides sediminis]